MFERCSRTLRNRRASACDVEKSTMVHSDAIRLRAYEIWEWNGRTHGHDQDDWRRAEAMLGAVPLELESETTPGAETDPSLMDSIKEEMQVIAETAGKAVHYVEELLGLVPTEKASH